MKLDIPTIAILSCLTSLTQAIALAVQYRLNRPYQGLGWWLAGTSISAIGVFFLPLVQYKAYIILAMLGNPLIILGETFIYIGILRFLGKQEKKSILIGFYSLVTFVYYFFMFVSNNLSVRTVVITVATILISVLSALKLFGARQNHFDGSAKFTAIIFLVYAFVSLGRLVGVLIAPALTTYSDRALSLDYAFKFPMLAGLLWTFGFIIMVNQRLHAEIHEEKEKLQKIFNTAPDAAMISRLSDGSIVDVNDGFVAMSGYSRDELIGNTTIGVKIWHNMVERQTFIDELIRNSVFVNRESVFQRKDMSTLTGSVTAKMISLQSKPHVFSIVHDITLKKAAEDALRESEELYRSILNASPDDITITDLQGQIQIISPAAKKMFGYEEGVDQFVGTQILDFLVPDDRESARANIVSMLQGNMLGMNEYHAIKKDGSIFDIEVTRGIIRDASGQPARLLYIVRDISERKKTDQRIQQLIQQLEAEKITAQTNAITDSLTGLANRRYFDEALNQEFFRLKRSGPSLSLIMLDVDHFKKFNDRFGHLAGDECLRRIGATLKSLTRRGNDIAARYGGEEFVVLMTDSDQEGAKLLAERIRTAIEALNIPHAVNLVSEFVTVSLGVVTAFPTRMESTDQLIGLADDAMYAAKDAGRNQTVVAVVRDGIPDLRAD